MPEVFQIRKIFKNYVCLFWDKFIKVIQFNFHKGIIKSLCIIMWSIMISLGVRWQVTPWCLSDQNHRILLIIFSKLKEFARIVNWIWGLQIMKFKLILIKCFVGNLFVIPWIKILLVSLSIKILMTYRLSHKSLIRFKH